MFAEPLAEVRRYLQLDPSEIIKLESAVYGLRNAPRRWFEKLSEDVKKMGWRQHQLDQCVFLLFDPGESGFEGLIGTLGAYVDDVMVAGDESNIIYRKAVDALKKAYTWGDWQAGTFKFTGVEVQQFPSGIIKVHQRSYADGLRQADVKQHVSDVQNNVLDQQHLRKLRGINGSLQWLVTNTRLDLAVKTSVSQALNESTSTHDLMEANKLIRQAHMHADLPLQFFPYPCMSSRFVPSRMQLGLYIEMEHRKAA